MNWTKFWSKCKKFLLVLGGLSLIITIILNLHDLAGIIRNYYPEEETQTSPVNILIEPDHITLGADYSKGLTLKVTIPDIKRNNITSLQLFKTGILIDRLNKTAETEISKSPTWQTGFGYDYCNEFFFYYPVTNGCANLNDNLTRTMTLAACPNCFVDQNSPYSLTFTVSYSINDGPIESYPINKILEIK